MPYELFCYIILSVIAVFGGKKNRTLLLTWSVFLCILIVVRAGTHNEWNFPSRWGLPVTGDFLVLAFLIGVCLYYYKDRVYVSGPRILIAVLVAVVSFPNGFFGELMGTAAAAYLAASLGVLNPKRLYFLKHADLSYGIFLYHAIIQQTIIYASPAPLGWVMCFLLSLVISCFIAFLSWRWIEEPVLSRKSMCYTFERQIADRLPKVKKS